MIIPWWLPHEPYLNAVDQELVNRGVGPFRIRLRRRRNGPNGGYLGLVR